MSVELSVVVPVYRAEDCLEALHQRLTAVLTELGRPYEIVLVEDAGPDASWARIQELAAKDEHVRGFQLSRNFGQHPAITAGLSQARGAWVVVMDCDLEDPPEEIPRLLAAAEEGDHDLVLARRRLRGQGFLRGLLSQTYFRLLSTFTQLPLDGRYGTFSLLSRKVVDAFLSFRDRNRHYLFILLWLGFRRGAIDYDQAERYAGTSSYTLGALVRHAIEGVFFQTAVLLRWIVYAGFAQALLGVLAAAVLVYWRLTGQIFPGWTSLVCLILLSSGGLMVSTGITGLYIGEVFEQVKSRPLFVVGRSTAGAAPGEARAGGGLAP